MVEQNHSEQFLSSLQTYAFDQIGKLPVAKIDTTVVLEVLKPIWYAKTVTAGRVRNRIESVLDWCTASGYRKGQTRRLGLDIWKRSCRPKVKSQKSSIIALCPSRTFQISWKRWRAEKGLTRGRWNFWFCVPAGPAR